MSSPRVGNGYWIVTGCALIGCAQVLGIDDLEYTLGGAGTTTGDGASGTAGSNSSGSSTGASSSGGLGGSSTSGSSGGGLGGSSTSGSSSGGLGGSGGASTGAFGGQGGADDGGAGSGGSAGTCAGHAGPVSVNVDGKFCIDSTEVTNAQYLEFLETAEPIDQPPECAWNVPVADENAFEPGANYWPPTVAVLDYPVREVDWCDAWSYCKFAGKRLCGNVDGTPPDFSNYGNSNNELYYACSNDGERAFPYGDEFDPNACPSIGRSSAVAVASFTRCVTPAGVYDLSGNVAEWQAPCKVGNDADDECRLGPYGVWNSTEYDKWSCAADFAHSRKTVRNDIGIRCCSDVL